MEVTYEGRRLEPMMVVRRRGLCVVMGLGCVAGEECVSDSQWIYKGRQMDVEEEPAPCLTAVIGPLLSTCFTRT